MRFLPEACLAYNDAFFHLSSKKGKYSGVITRAPNVVCNLCLLFPVVFAGQDCEADGDYAHPQNEHAYIRCIQGVSVERKCSHGLVFSRLMSRCDYAY